MNEDNNLVVQTVRYLIGISPLIMRRCIFLNSLISQIEELRNENLDGLRSELSISLTPMFNSAMSKHFCMCTGEHIQFIAEKNVDDIAGLIHAVNSIIDEIPKYLKYAADEYIKKDIYTIIHELHK